MKSQCDGLRSINHASKLCASGISGTIVLDIVGDEERWTALREVSRLHPVVEPVGALKHLPFSVYSDWNRSVTGEKAARPHDASTDLSGCLCIVAEPEEVAHSLPTCSDCELCDLEKSEAVPFPFLALSREEADVKIKREKVFSSQPSIGGRSRQDTFSWKSTDPTIRFTRFQGASKGHHRSSVGSSTLQPRYGLRLQQSWCGCPRWIPYAMSRQSMGPLGPEGGISHQIRIFYFNLMFFVWQSLLPVIFFTFIF